MDEKQSMESLENELAETRARLEQVLSENRRLESKTEHLNFLDNALDGYFFTNEREEVLFVNLFFARLMGYDEATRGALIGQPLARDHWMDPQEIDHFMLSLQGGSVRDRKIQMLDKDRVPFRVSLSAVHTHNHRGEVVGTQYTVRPLPPAPQRGTADLRAENRELAAMTAISRSVLSTMNVSQALDNIMETVSTLFDVDAAWVYLKQNSDSPQLVSHHGLTEEEIRNVASAVDHYSAFDKAISDGESRYFTPAGPAAERVLLTRHLGMESLAVAPLQAHEKTIGLLAIAGRESPNLPEKELQLLERIAQYTGLAISNATLYENLQSAYEELKHAQEQLVEAERQKVAVEMAGAAAHELNQPLTVLMGYSNLLVRTMQDDDPQRAILEKIERNTRKISEVVARLGQITRYRTRNYIEGQGILDIEAASRPDHEAVESESA